MKSLYLLCIPLLFTGAAEAQVRHVLSLTTGTFFPNDPGHDVSTQFPYTVTDITNGNVSQQTFSGTLQGKFTSPMSTFGLNYEVSQRHDALDIGVGLFDAVGGDRGFYLQSGYRYVL